MRDAVPVFATSAINLKVCPDAYAHIAGDGVIAYESLPVDVDQYTSDPACTCAFVAYILGISVSRALIASLISSITSLDITSSIKSHASKDCAVAV